MGPGTTETLAPEELIIKGLEVLNIDEGDVVLIKTTQSKLSEAAGQRIAARIQAHCERLGLQTVGVILIPKDIDVRVLDPAAMREVGYERRPHLVIAPAGSLPVSSN